MKKKMIGIFSCALLCLASSSMISAYATETLDVPGWNGSAFSDVDVVKATDDSKASFKTSSRASAFGMDARVINDDNVSRSKWARNMNEGTLIKVATTAQKNYYYGTEVSSDFYEVNTNSITFKWSPDNESLK